MGHQSSLPQNTARTTQEIMEHILAHRTVTASECWEWTGLRSVSGYGKIKWHGRHLRVHRVAAMLWLGMNLNDAEFACHRCDNPPCFNPEHLFIGTAKDNQIDCVLKKRHHCTKKEQCKNGHPYDAENTYFRSDGSRSCRECHKIAERQKYKNKVGICA